MKDGCNGRTWVCDVDGCVDNGCISIRSVVEGGTRWWIEDGEWWMHLCNSNWLSDGQITRI